MVAALEIVEKVQLDRRFAAEHADQHLHLAAGFINLGYLTLEVFERAIGDANRRIDGEDRKSVV